jgi:ribosome maturation factor RimP
VRGDDVRHEELTALLAPVVEALGLELLGVEFVPQRGNALVRLYIDAPARAVTLDDCEKVSREAGATLDVNDPVTGHYTLEVSSPGLDRPLFTPAHFARFIGDVARIQVNVPIAGRRRFQGPILAVEGEHIVLDQDGQTQRIDHANVLRANLVAQLGKTGQDNRPGKRPGVKKAKK